MKRVREYAEGDLEALRQIHARQGFDYPFPDLGDPLFVSKLVLAEGDGEEPEASGGKGIVGAALLRVTAEAYLLLDPHEGTARERWNWLLALHGASERDAWRRGSERRVCAAAAADCGEIWAPTRAIGMDS